MLSKMVVNNKIYFEMIIDDETMEKCYGAEDDTMTVSPDFFPRRFVPFKYHTPTHSLGIHPKNSIARHWFDKAHQQGHAKEPQWIVEGAMELEGFVIAEKEGKLSIRWRQETIAFYDVVDKEHYPGLLNELQFTTYEG